MFHFSHCEVLYTIPRHFSFLWSSNIMCENLLKKYVAKYSIDIFLFNFFLFNLSCHRRVASFLLSSSARFPISIHVLCKSNYSFFPLLYIGIESLCFNLTVETFESRNIFMSVRIGISCLESQRFQFPSTQENLCFSFSLVFL